MPFTISARKFRALHVAAAALLSTVCASASRGDGKATGETPAALPQVANPASVSAAKSPVEPAGTWTWPTVDRNGATVFTTLTISVDNKGNVSGWLSDRLGRRAIQNVKFNQNNLTFEVIFHSRGFGNFPHTYSLSLDPDNLVISISRPDLSTKGHALGKVRQETHSTKHKAT